MVKEKAAWKDSAALHRFRRTGIGSVTQVGITQKFYLCQTAITKGFLLDLLIQTDIYLILYGHGGKILNLEPCRALYFLLFAFPHFLLPVPTSLLLNLLYRSNGLMTTPLSDDHTS